jgi:iron complex outermembrane receptor protein
MLDLTYMDRKKDDPVATYLSDPLTAAQFQRDRNLYAQMVYNEDLSNEKLNVLARLFYGEAHYSGRYFYSATPFFYETTSQWLGGEVRLLSTHWDNHKMMVGLEYQDNLQQKLTETETNPSNPPNYNIVKSGYRVGLYMQDEWALLDSLSTTLGIRLDNNNITGTDISPRVGLIWQVNNATTAKALYGRAFRAPNTNEQYYQDSITLPNPSLKGEQIDTFELVGEHRLASDLKVTASIYEWKIKNLIAFVETAPGSTIMQSQNADDVTAHGIELSVDKTYNWGGRLRGSLSYQQSTYDKASHPLENSPNTLAKLNFMAPWHAAGVKVGYELQYNGDRRDLQGGTVTGHWLSNLNLMSDQWIKGLEVSLSLYNLFDIQYFQPAGPNNWQNTLQQDGRQVRLKAIYKF